MKKRPSKDARYRTPKPSFLRRQKGDIRSQPARNIVKRLTPAFDSEGRLTRRSSGGKRQNRSILLVTGSASPENLMLRGRAFEH